MIETIEMIVVEWLFLAELRQTVITDTQWEPAVSGTVDV